MNKWLVDRRKTPFFSAVSNAISYNDSSIKQFINLPFSIENFEKQISRKSETFSVAQRLTLANQIEQQYKGLPLSQALTENIAALKGDNCFTVTTGHQLCLFGGPLYFFYKIIHTIRLSEKLKQAYPKNHFVPVFWMASEDHDFEEVNHVHVFGKKVAWDTASGNAVGQLNLKDIGAFKDELLAIFKNDLDTHAFIEKYYVAADENLACATRRFVNDMFGDSGLVILDGNDKELKQSFVPVMKKEILEEFSFHEVEKTIEALRNQGFKPQVNPREINLFYLGEKERTRIKLLDGVVELDGRSHTPEEVLRLLEQHPERFSPNVILRPLYQEFILPNLAYIGGGGEMAYWLELKGVFNALNMPYPIIQVRNSLQVLDSNNTKKIAKLHLHVEQFFCKLEDLKKEYIEQTAKDEMDFTTLDLFKRNLTDELTSVVERVDDGLRSYAMSEVTRLNNQIEGVKQKLIRHEKKKHDTELSSLENTYHKMFPSGALQERKDSFLSLIAIFGKDQFLRMIFDAIDPEENGLIVISE